MFDIDTILAVFDVFPGDFTAVPACIAVDHKSAELDGILPEEAVISHPVGEQDRSQTFTLDAEVVIALDADSSAQVVIGMRPQCGARIDAGVINAAVAADGEADAFHAGCGNPGKKAHNCPRPHDNVTDRFTFVDVFPETRLTPAHFLFLFICLYFGNFLIGIFVGFGEFFVFPLTL